VEENSSRLKPGDRHYMAYVGPPQQYDFMGATQFCLLCAPGLRSRHYLLDFGCGSLRAGRLLIGYLDQDRYFGIEPNKWLVDDAIKYQIGEDVLRIKRPQFDYNHDFLTNVFPVQFDYIVAQSIFSHAGANYIEVALHNFKESLKPDGLIVATFIEGDYDYSGTGWVYPGCVNYRPETINMFAERAGLFCIRIPWYHPRQTWYLFAREIRQLPDNTMLEYLSGAVLYDSEFTESWKKNDNYEHSTRNSWINALFRSIMKMIKS
jgi:SAM-dependent methyltransferase